MKTIVDFLVGVGTILTLLIAIVVALLSLAEVLYKWGAPVPGFYERWKENEMDRIKEAVELIYNERKNEVSRVIEKIYREEYDTLFRHEEIRLKSLLHQLEITIDEFSEYRSEIMSICYSATPDIESCRNTLKDICTSEVALIDQRTLSNPQYTAVQYYVNLTDVMTDGEDYGMRNKLTQFMCDLIKSKYDRDDYKRCTIVVPTKSNFLLGYEVSQELSTPFVKMKESPRIKNNQYWDGKLDKECNVIMVHDVTVTTEQIRDSIEKLPQTVAVKGVCTLVRRSDERFSSEQKRLSPNLHSLIDIDDEWIKNNI